MKTVRQSKIQRETIRVLDKFQHNKELAVQHCENKAKVYMEAIKEKGFFPLDCPNEMRKLLNSKVKNNRVLYAQIMEWNNEIIFWSDVKKEINKMK
jgi:hypothetical protein